MVGRHDQGSINECLVQRNGKMEMLAGWRATTFQTSKPID